MFDLEITSRQNPLVVRLAKLSDKRHRAAERMFLCEGIKLAEEAAEAGAVRYLLCTPDAAALPRVQAVIRKVSETDGCTTVSVTREVMEKISTENAPQGVIAVCGMLDERHRDGAAEFLPGFPLIILDRVRDPGNLGTIFRTAEVFGITRLVLAGCADIYNPKTVRGSMGALFSTESIAFASAKDAVDAAKRAGYTVYGAALDSSAVRLGEVSLCADAAVVIGTEGEGIEPDTLAACDGTLYIPMCGGESLNCAVAASVIMWEMHRGRL